MRSVGANDQHHDGAADLRRVGDALAARLPERLRPLAHAAYNYRWSWTPGAPELFESIDPERWERVEQNPVALLTTAPAAALEAAANDPAVVAHAEALWNEIESDLSRPAASGEGLDPAHPIAFLCAEFGIHASLPIYSGGLGALAGDILKEASDRALPMVAVGLMYRRGYFRQRIDAAGLQHEHWAAVDPDLLPAARICRADGTQLTITLPIAGEQVTAAVWRVAVGRVPLFLLDTEVPENGPMQHWVTARLYDGDPDTRLSQYALLGAGSVRALSALGITPGVFHLNEGHAVLAPLQLASHLGRDEAGRAGALDAARARTVFTTHTPVPAGNDTYPAEQVTALMSGLLQELELDPQALIAYGRTNPADADEPFGITQAALRLSHSAGGVSRRHGEVARDMWRQLWPERELAEVPIGYVTNGVHVPTWLGAPMRRLLDEQLGEGWLFGADPTVAWEAIDRVSDEALWQARCAQRAELVDHLRGRSLYQRLERGDTREYVTAAAGKLDPDVLTIGFARRLATYKRLDLLIRDPDFVKGLLSGERPAQIVLAGKAHPRDDEAKRMLQRVFGLKYAREVAERVVFLDNYDLTEGARLTRGCDLWLNLPRPPLEASGTSGMKSTVNGGLQLSVLDGWWAEGYDGSNGWAIDGEVDSDPAEQDARHSTQLQRLLLEEVLPDFYDRDANGLPSAWLDRVRRSMRTLGPRFAATRMLDEYVAGPYRGASAAEQA
jgi:starch phosphorylase